MSVALIIQLFQLSKRLRIIISSSSFNPSRPSFSTLSHKRKDLRKEVLDIKRSSDTAVTLRRTERDVITNVHKSSGKMAAIFVRF